MFHPRYLIVGARRLISKETENCHLAAPHVGLPAYEMHPHVIFGSRFQASLPRWWLAGWTRWLHVSDQSHADGNAVLISDCHNSVQSLWRCARIQSQQKDTAKTHPKRRLCVRFRARDCAERKHNRMF